MLPIALIITFASAIFGYGYLQAEVSNLKAEVIEIKQALVLLREVDKKIDVLSSKFDGHIARDKEPKGIAATK